MADDAVIKGNDDYTKLPAGSFFKGPDGARRQKPYSVKDDEGYQSIPDGSHFTDPQGNLRVKPTYSGISSDAQAIFDEAVNPKEQENALTHFYGKDKVKRNANGELYVEESPAKRLKPGKGSFANKAGAFVRTAAAPVTLGGAGEVAGAGMGTVGGPVGMALGSMAGAGVGNMAGQGYNDAMLALMGVYDRTPLEELAQLGTASEYGIAGSAGGQVVGKIAGKAIDAVKDIPKGVKALEGMAPAALRKWFGAEGEGFNKSVELAKQGIPVPVESWAKGAFMPKMIQKWAKQITGTDPVAPRAESHYNIETNKILNQLGVQPEEAATRTTAAASSEQAGKSVLTKAKEDMINADMALDVAHKEALRRAGVAPEEEKAKSVQELQKAIDNNMKVAQSIIDEGWDDINKTRAQLLESSKVGTHPGDLSRTMADKIEGVSKAVRGRARIIYNAADVAAGGKLPNIAPVKEQAKEFIKSLPEGFAKKYPNDIALLAKIGGGKPVTFGQVHQIRSFLRHGIDYNDLTPDFRTGSLRKFEYAINNVLHDGEAEPELKAAAQLMDKADKYYARNMAAFHDAKLQGLIDVTESGLPPNPSVIAKMVMEQDAGWTERMTKIRRLVTPQVWKAVQAADLQNMVNASKTLIPGEINPQKFADQILKRYQTGVLENGYDKETASKLLKQAQRVAIHGGKLDFKLLPGDTVSTAMARINAAQSAIDQIVSKDPYGVLSTEVKKIETEHAQRLAEQKAARSADPLNFLNDPSALAMSSADKILSTPDLIKAAAVRFGPESGEFKMLRQVAAQRLLQRNLAKTMKLGGDFADYSSDVQKLLFPNGLDQSVKKLGEQMAVLFPREGGDFGANMSGVLLGTHPKEAVQKIIKHKLLGPEFLHRIYVSAALEKASAFFSNPKLIMFFAQRGTPMTEAEVNDVAKSALQYSKYGGTFGAMAGAATNQEQKKPATKANPAPKHRDWRDIYKERYGQ